MCSEIDNRVFQNYCFFDLICPNVEEVSIETHMDNLYFYKTPRDFHSLAFKPLFLNLWQILINPFL